MVAIVRYDTPFEICSVEEQSKILDLFRQLDVDEEVRWKKIVPTVDLSYRLKMTNLSDRWVGKSTCLFVLYENAQPIGIVEWHKSEDEGARWLTVVSVCVDAKHRLKGHATALVKHVAAYAKYERIDVVILCVNALNLDAVSLYKKLGFAIATHDMTLKI